MQRTIEKITLKINPEKLCEQIIHDCKYHLKEQALKITAWILTAILTVPLYVLIRPNIKANENLLKLAVPTETTITCFLTAFFALMARILFGLIIALVMSDTTRIEYLNTAETRRLMKNVKNIYKHCDPTITAIPNKHKYLLSQLAMTENMEYYLRNNKHHEVIKAATEDRIKNAEYDDKKKQIRLLVSQMLIPASTGPDGDIDGDTNTEKNVPDRCTEIVIRAEKNIIYDREEPAELVLTADKAYVNVYENIPETHEPKVDMQD